VKALFAILFSALLAGVQLDFTADSLCRTAPTKGACACSHCGKPSCCATRSGP